uniref:ATP synthase complex subunit 8 n=1 Tax=Liposcelis bostrychophila TaxID=185214 RepID=A0A3Q8CJG8_LIPBO|nr:ATP synthase F0 subunit 8 [Liposcelis bostrychophila]ATU74569.1 ATP synthase F0 subunit 8 [Liposcelis bostrychophila]UNO31835.1 ATP synthase F0 subunit 8 [Liposcelis bostrychophila]UNO31848.1 ATP synthase F0 subunit 8 [Liposcelis bostrychophila]
MPQMAPLWWSGSLMFIILSLNSMYQLLYFSIEASTPNKSDDSISFLNLWPL